MKAPQRSQRRSPQQDGPGISLFPFLAVLICTMGALVPLLLAVTRTARLQAEAAAAAKLARQGTEVQTQREDVQWRIKQLKQSRATTESQLADARLQLGHLEEHSRGLRSQLAQYERMGRDLEQSEKADRQRLSQSRAELEHVRTQIQVAQQQVAQAHQSAAGRTPCYAVVPYEGPNQTRRRPIYLECRDEAVVLQPEGLALGESDFEGPLGPSNPLATALRAAREYMLTQRDFDPLAGEPYPMLLVRPDGINAYYAARAAMKSWGFDFGYELVGNDWKLAYPPPDPRLVELLRQVIASARASQARLIAAAPRHYDTRPKEVYRASPGGGFIREGGAADDDAAGYRSASPAGRVGAMRGGGRGTGDEGTTGNPYLASTERPGAAVPGSGSGAIGGTGTGGPALTGTGFGAGSGQGFGSGSGAIGGAGTGGPALAGTGFGGGSGQGFGSGSGAIGGAGTGGPSSTGTGIGGGSGQGFGSGSGAVGGTGTGGPALTGTGLGGGSGQGFGSGSGTSGGTGSSGPALAGTGTGGGSGQTANGLSGGAYGASTGNPESGGATDGRATNPYQSNASSVTCPHPNPLPKGEGTSDGSTVSSGAGTERAEGYIVGQPQREQPARTASTGSVRPDDVQPGYALRPGEWQPTPEPPPQKHDDKDKDDDDKRAAKHKKRPSDQRGADWGLRDAARGSVGVTRPIRVDCYADRLVVYSDRGPGDNKVIALGPRTGSSVNPLISAIWECMEAWGMAGRGMYWRPILEVYVAPDAEQRFVDLSALLENSGLTVERK